MDGVVELLVAGSHADHGASVVRLDGFEADAEAVEQVLHVTEDLRFRLDGGVVVDDEAFLFFVVVVKKEREDAGLVALVGWADEARRPQAVELEAQIALGRAQLVEAVFEGVTRRRA